MSVVHESSNLSETVSNMVSYIQNTTTPHTPLYETTQQAEGKSLLYLRQSPSARLLSQKSRITTFWRIKKTTPRGLEPLSCKATPRYQLGAIPVFATTSYGLGGIRTHDRFLSREPSCPLDYEPILFPATFDPFGLPDHNGAGKGGGILWRVEYARADSNYLSAGYVRLNEPPLQHSYISGLADHCLPPLKKKQRVHAGQLTTLHYNYN